MNGRLSTEFFSLRTLGAWPGPPGGRVWAALAASLALHAVVVLLPDLGVRSFALEPSPAGARGGGPEAVLEVKLREREPAPRTDAPAPHSEAPAPKPRQRRAASASPGGMELLPFPAHHFYARDQLTSPARPAGVPNFDMAAMAPAFSSGTVVLKVYIDALGTVVAVQVEKSEVPRPLADGAAAAFRALQFRPGEIAGRRVASFTRFEVTYIDGERVSVKGLAR
jgi:TonB family protein